MNLSNLRKCIVERCSILVVVLSVAAVASAGRTPQRSEPEHKPAPSRPAQHAAPAHKPAPHKPAQHAAPAHKPAPRKPAQHAAPAHKPAPSKPAQHAAPAHKPAPSKSVSHAVPAHKPAPKPAAHAAPAEHPAGHPAASEPKAAGEHTSPAEHTPAGEHAATTEHPPAGEHTATTEHSPTGIRNVSLKGGGSASVRSNGQIRSVNRDGMHIDHGVNGGRTVVSEHNGVRVVNTGRNSGYVQRSYMNVGGHSYYSRTYYYHGSYHTAVYRGYYWHGHAYYGFHAGFWFHPGFYAWGYRPWGAPVFWSVGAWGWGGAPWWGFYGGWFTPYPSYPAPAYWLTDYLIAAELQSAYAARQEAAADAAVATYGDGGGTAPTASASSTVTLSPEVKEAIADEVKVQLAIQEAQAQNSATGAQAAVPTPPTAQAPNGIADAQTSANAPQQNGGSDNQAAPASASTPANATEEVPPALDPARRTFVVDGDLSVTANGQECGLTAGNVLTRLTDTPDADDMVNASVSASKKSDCAAGLTVSVKVNDLQEMQNHFDEQLDNGLKELAKKQGTDGMPKAPDTGVVESDIPAPKPDTTADKTLQDQQQAADQTETQVKQEAAAPEGGQPKTGSDEDHN